MALRSVVNRGVHIFQPISQDDQRDFNDFACPSLCHRSPSYKCVQCIAVQLGITRSVAAEDNRPRQLMH